MKSTYDKAYKQLKRSIQLYLPSSADLTAKGLPEFLQNVDMNLLIEASPTILLVLNLQTIRYDYVSRNMKTILGYDPALYLTHGIEFSMSTMDPSHLHIHNSQIYVKILRYTQQYMPSGQLKNLRFNTTFKAKKSCGTYIWMMQQLSIVVDEANGAPLFYLCFLNDISEIKKDSHPDLIVSLKGKEGVYEPIYRESYPSEEIHSVFSKRELQVLQLLSKGLSSKKIAEQLFVSEHTVNRHRQNMLRKTKSTNTTELFRYCATHQFLTLL